MDGLVIKKNVLSFRKKKKLYFHSDRKNPDPPGYEMGGPLESMLLINMAGDFYVHIITLMWP